MQTSNFVIVPIFFRLDALFRSAGTPTLPNQSLTLDWKSGGMPSSASAVHPATQLLTDQKNNPISNSNVKLIAGRPSRAAF